MLSRRQVLPSWKVSLSGSISFKFSTNEKNGLLLYNGAGGSLPAAEGGIGNAHAHGHGGSNKDNGKVRE